MRALIERPYSRRTQTVGAIYDRPSFFVQSRFLSHPPGSGPVPSFDPAAAHLQSLSKELGEVIRNYILKYPEESRWLLPYVQPQQTIEPSHENPNIPHKPKAD